MALRDDRTFFTPNTYKNYYIPNGIVYGQGTIEPGYMSTRTYRDESTPTTPLSSGTFVESTNYDAFFSYATNRPYGYSYGIRSISGTASDHRIAIPYALFYGCQKSYPHIPSVPGYIQTRCENIVLSKIKGGDVNVGVMLGELPEAIQLVGNTLVSVARLFKAIKNRDARAAREAVKRHFRESGRNDPGGHPSRIPKVPAKAWLEYQYGWKPMMGDIYSICKRTNDRLADHEVYSVSHSELDPAYSSTDPTPLSGVNNERWKYTGQLKRGCEVGVSFGLANHTTYQLDKLGLLNPWSIVWELTPFSFIFDWFLPVGNFLKSFTTGLGLSFKTGYKTLFLKNSMDFEYIHNSQTSATGKLRSNYIRTTSMRRTRLASYPVPIPYFDPQLDISKILNGLALIIAIRP